MVDVVVNPDFVLKGDCPIGITEGNEARFSRAGRVRRAAVENGSAARRAGAGTCRAGEA